MASGKLWVLDDTNTLPTVLSLVMILRPTKKKTKAEFTVNTSSRSDCGNCDDSGRNWGLSFGSVFWA